MDNKKGVTILGATGSIGVSTLDVLARHSDRFSVVALTANTNVQIIFEQAMQFTPKYAVMRDPESALELGKRLKDAGSKTEVLAGSEGLVHVAGLNDTDYVMAAIVGSAGLLPTMEAVKKGKRVLLANKEALVMGGALFMNAVAESGAELLPIDSEHNAIFQCLPRGYGSGAGADADGVARVLLTGSGGPFRQLKPEQLKYVTPDQACAHPNWEMGRKISVDSATMMNKGLEYIEACWMFDLSPAEIEVLIHPQSIVHSMVEYSDGSVLAQLGNPDMRTPIAYGLSWPERMVSGVPLLDLVKAGRLDFEAVDEVRFPCLKLAREAVLEGKTASVILNAANEVAVEAFLKEQIRFDSIPVVVENTLAGMGLTAASSLEVVLAADEEARHVARQLTRDMSR